MPNKITIAELFKSYNEALDSALKMIYLVRDAQLQSDEAEKLNKLKSLVKNVKYQAIEQGNEKLANKLFHLQSVLNSVSSILNMWIALKKEQYTVAWCLLIDAQEYLDLALKAIQGEEGPWGLEEYRAKLLSIEHVCFPGFPMYNSWGAKLKGGKCSICVSYYDKCDHIDGLIYSGRLCTIIKFESLEADHSSLVDNPRDRRCIINKISTDEGLMRDYITWKITDERAPQVQDVNPGEGRYLRCTLFVNKSIESD